MDKKNITILITDDEHDILDLLRGELSEANCNFNIVTAESGYEALNYIQSEKVDILITDIAMPDMDGYELYTRSVEIKPDLPIIMMTGFGYDPFHTMVNAKKAGLRDVIFKPFDMTKILALIYQIVSEIQE